MKYLKVLATTTIVLGTLVMFLISLDVNSPAYNLSLEYQESCRKNAIWSLFGGAILIVAIWFPWKKVMKKDDSDAQTRQGVKY
jgi:hypothetical protein